MRSFPTVPLTDPIHGYRISQDQHGNAECGSDVIREVAFAVNRRLDHIAVLIHRLFALLGPLLEYLLYLEVKDNINALFAIVDSEALYLIPALLVPAHQVIQRLREIFA